MYMYMMTIQTDCLSLKKSKYKHLCALMNFERKNRQNLCIDTSIPKNSLRKTCMIISLVEKSNNEMDMIMI